MWRVLWRLTRGYRLAPWRSPYLRWRMETYWGVHADQIGFADFWQFVWRHRADLARYLRWAREQEAQAGSGRLLPLPAGEDEVQGRQRHQAQQQSR